MGKTHPNSYFLELYERGLEIISKDEIDELEKETIEKIKKVDAYYNKTCISYSAGKDSIVLQNLINKSGISHRPVMWMTIYQYPSFLNWLKDHEPRKLHIEILSKPTWLQLENESDLLFCKTPDANTYWMAQKWKAQNSYLKDNNFDLLITGRRLGDGNNCGSKKKLYVRKAKNYDIFSPLAEWSYEQVFGYIRHRNLSLPPHYFYKDGFIHGSGAWAERISYGLADKTDNEHWKELYLREPQIVIEAANYLSSAKMFLKGQTKNENRDCKTF